MHKVIIHWYHVENMKSLKSIKISEKIIFKPYVTGDTKDVAGEVQLLTECDFGNGTCIISELSYQHIVSFECCGNTYELKKLDHDNHRVYLLENRSIDDCKTYIVMSPKGKIYIFDGCDLGINIRVMLYRTVAIEIPSVNHLEIHDDFFYNLEEKPSYRRVKVKKS